MTHPDCDNLDCPDCHPEHWQPEDDNYQAWGWPWAVVILILIIALSFVIVAGAPE